MPVKSQVWLENKHWQTNVIKSGANWGHWVFWGFAIVWNLISLPILFQTESLLDKADSEPVALIAFLFPLVGVFLLAGALLATLRWYKFGAAPITLDPYPGSIGGHVGGSVDTPISFLSKPSCHVSLTCLYSYMSGSGKNRKRHEKVLWQNQGVCHPEASAKGTRFQFRFDVPDDLPESDVKNTGSYHLWRVSLSAEIKGLDFIRQYQIPVFARGEQSSIIRNSTEDFHATIQQATDGIESIADITSIPGGVEVYFPAFQRPAQGIMLSLIGGIFTGAGFFMGKHDAPLFFAGIFGLIGLLILTLGVFYLGKSMKVTVTSTSIKSSRFFLRMPMRRVTIDVADFEGYEIKQTGTMQSGKKSTVYYQVLAKGSDKTQVVGERLASRAEAELLISCFENYMTTKT